MKLELQTNLAILGAPHCTCFYHLVEIYTTPILLGMKKCHVVHWNNPPICFDVISYDVLLFYTILICVVIYSFIFYCVLFCLLSFLILGWMILQHMILDCILMICYDSYANKSQSQGILLFSHSSPPISSFRDYGCLMFIPPNASALPCGNL